MAYKVVQWATGEVGMQCLKEVIRRPDLELVGLYAYSEKKSGMDAGELAGGEKVGVAATCDKEAIFALDADCVLFTPLAAELEKLDEDVIRILESGKNVVTAAGYFAPEARGGDIAERLAAACKKGNTTLFGTGIEPGFMFDRLGPTLSGLCAEAEQIRLTEICDATIHPAVIMLSDAIGIGKLPHEHTSASPFGQYFAAFFSEMVVAVANGMGVKLDTVETAMEVVAATEDVHVPALGVIKPGHVIGSKHSATGIVNGKRLIESEIYWFVGKPANWPVPNDRFQWRIEIEGRPSIRMVLDTVPSLARPDQIWPDPAFSGTAATVVNAIPDVVAAPAGLMHTPIFAPLRDWSV